MQTQSQEREGELVQLAERQHRVVSWNQLLALGFGPGAIKYRVRIGRLSGVHRGVFRVGPGRLTPSGRWMAAVLACGPGAALSHQSAGMLHGLLRSQSARLDVTRPGADLRRFEGITLHCSQLDPRDVTRVDGIPVTSVSRTLLDLAEVLHFQRLKDALEAADRLDLFDLYALNDQLERSKGRRGLKPLRKALKEYAPSPMTRSELERMFLRFCDEHGIPRPAMNVIVEGFDVDGYWAEHSLVLELDSWEWHKTRAAFERDHFRDAMLDAKGYRVARVTDRMMREEPELVVALLRMG